MQLGFCLPFAGSWATPDNQVTVARRAEELGYSSLWVAQRLLYPLEPRNDYPSAPGQPWPAPFQRVGDPIVTLAHVAGATRRIRLGAATLGDGYLGGNVPLDRGVPLVAELRAAAAAAGRDAGSFRIVCRGSVRLSGEPLGGDDRRPLWGSLDQIRSDVVRYRDAGLDE